MTFIFRLVALLVFTWIGQVTSYALAIERPVIWVTKEEKNQQVLKVNQHDWAKSRLLALKKRTDEIAPISTAQRAARIKKLPLQWDNLYEEFPAFIRQKSTGNNHLRKPLQLSLQGAIDCSVMYYFTEDEKYAQCGADILFNVTQGLTSTPINKAADGNNNGWIIPDNHLLESRIYSAQIPIIYDFLHEYLISGGLVFDGHRNKLVKFNFEAAQEVFKAYAQMALDSGLIDNNWPVLESSSLVHNALAIDDDRLRNQYLSHYLQNDTPNQDSLAKVAKSFVNQGDIWPESLNYSKHVAYFSLYLMDLIDRFSPDFNLGKKYPNIAAALLTYEQYRFPNGAYPAFGDGNRFYKPNYFEFELAYLSAVLNGHSELAATFAAEIAHAIEKGKYDRSILMTRHTEAKPYFAPLELLWPVEELTQASTDTLFNDFTTVDIPFAGFYIQRNVNTKTPKLHGLMATTGGGSYVHGHASGIDLELYGQGHVLGIAAGKGKYRSKVHENYKRLFAGHNTVISNGASASKGDWINLGINQVQVIANEPEFRQVALTENYSFITTQFFDEHNLVAPAEHQRTTVIIRLSDNQGYYVDVFRAKSNTESQFHDYLYRNLAESLLVTRNGQSVAMSSQPNRYPPALTENMKGRHAYAHPGWQYFFDIASSSKSEQGAIAIFKAKGFKNQTISMKAHIVEGLDVSISKAMTPASKIEASPYNKLPIPIMLLRHYGDTWSNPFVLVYEPTNDEQQSAVINTERIIDQGVFKGIRVTSKVKQRKVEHVILMQESIDDRFDDPINNIEFVGLFGIASFTDGQLTDLYIGEGKSLSYQSQQIEPTGESSSAYQQF